MSETNLKLLPILPLRNVVPLPRSIIPIKVQRPFSIKAISTALENDGEVFVTMQSSDEIDKPEFEHINKIGIKAKILQTTQENDNSFKVLIEGLARFKIIEEQSDKDFFSALCEEIQDIYPDESESEALNRRIKSLFKQYANDNEKITPEIIKIVKNVSDLKDTVDIVAVHLNVETPDRQELLEQEKVEQRGIKIAGLLSKEIEIYKADKNIKRRIQTQIEKHQKDYYLNEQVRAIHHELGKEDAFQEIEKFREKAKKLKMTPEAHEKLFSECKRLEQMQSTSPEAAVSRNYIDWLLAVPWSKGSKDRISLSKAEGFLNASHFGMKKTKERILEFIAAKKFAGEKLEKSPIICLVGPPGVGKTSIASSIAKALSRQFIRISLGGLRDEAEIRGHRRTYIGAMPGKIIAAMKKAGVTNPVILLDEIDKVAMDFRGDPSSALLEILDPEQNKDYADHFLEVGYDLSKVFFITTANTVDGIPAPLLDRMEAITLAGYTAEEKLEIAKKFLLPNTLEEHNLKPSQLKLSDEITQEVINHYTREAGVRHLGQLLAKITRKSIQEIMAKDKKRITVSPKMIEEWLGYPKFKQCEYFKKIKESVGVSTGLAWTEAGGDILEVEAVFLKGKGGLTITGQLGEVMQESIQAALSYIRSESVNLGLKKDFYADADLHIHLPEGAIPKDGPSAGVTITVAMVSVLSGIKVDRSVAMTGEISLQGRVLAVGGLKEKILAAIRLGIKKVLVPKENLHDINEFEDDLKDTGIKIVYIDHVKEALLESLVQSPFKQKKTTTRTAKTQTTKKSTSRAKK